MMLWWAALLRRAVTNPDHTRTVLTDNNVAGHEFVLADGEVHLMVWMQISDVLCAARATGSVVTAAVYKLDGADPDDAPTLDSLSVHGLVEKPDDGHSPVGSALWAMFPGETVDCRRCGDPLGLATDVLDTPAITGLCPRCFDRGLTSLQFQAGS